MKYTILKWRDTRKHTPKPCKLLLIKNIVTLKYHFAVYIGPEFAILATGNPKLISKNVVYEWAYIPEVKINAK